MKQKHIIAPKRWLIFLLPFVTLMLTVSLYAECVPAGRSSEKTKKVQFEFPTPLSVAVGCETFSDINPCKN